MTISNEQRKQLKAKAHHLHPVIITGSKGLTQNLALETDRALDTHELIKVRINAADRQSRAEMAQALCMQCHAEFVHMIGHIAIIYRKRVDDKKG